MDCPGGLLEKDMCTFSWVSRICYQVLAQLAFRLLGCCNTSSFPPIMLMVWCCVHLSSVFLSVIYVVWIHFMGNCLKKQIGWYPVVP